MKVIDLAQTRDVENRGGRKKKSEREKRGREAGRDSVRVSAGEGSGSG